MPEQNTEPVGLVEINGAPYRLLRGERGRAWQADLQDEPPYSGGVPSLISEPQPTWHVGGLKSQQGFPGTSEYGQNTSTRRPFSIRPSGKITTVTLSGNGTPVTDFFELGGYLFTVGGRYVHRIDPNSGDAVVQKDLGASVVGVSGAKWEGNIGYVTTDAATQSLWKVVSPYGTGNWSQTADVKAYLIDADIDRLYKIDRDGILKNAVVGVDPFTEANWADSVQVGDGDSLATDLKVFERSVLIGMPDGLYGVGQEGRGIPLIRRMATHADNCRGMTFWEPYMLVPHSRGLFQFMPGTAQSVGLEKEMLNHSPIQARFAWLVSEGQNAWGAIPVGSDTYILAGRNATGNEASFGPLVWDPELYFTGTSKAGHLSNLTTTPRFWFGKGNDVAYVQLSDTGTPWATSGNRYTNKLRFNDWGSKHFPFFDIVGAGLTANRHWTIAYSVDGAAFSDTDISGATMRITSNGRQRFILPTSATGREIQFRLTFSSDSDAAMPEIVYFEAYAIPQSKKVPTYGVRLQLGPFKQDQTNIMASADEQLAALQALAENASPVLSTGPWGKDIRISVRNLTVTEQVQEGSGNPEYVADVVVIKRETA